MKYVKLIARPDTWFKAGTEVWNYDIQKQRVTLEEWNDAEKFGAGIGVRGIHVGEEDSPNERGNGHLPGEEWEDGEWCGCDEFDVTETDNPNVGED